MDYDRESKEALIEYVSRLPEHMGFNFELLMSKKDLKEVLKTPAHISLANDVIVAVLHSEISNTDPDLGETDITVILSSGTDIYALLIEDKIDAVAQKEQHDQYIKRGDKAVAEGLYTDYRVF